MLGDAEAEPGAAITTRRRAVGLGEGVENVPLLVARDADAGIGHVEGDEGRGSVRFDRLDAKANFALLSELDRIADQVGHDLAQPSGIADQRRRQVRRDRAGQFQPLAISHVGEGFGHLFDQIAQVERGLLELDLAGLDFRDVEDAVDDPEQCLGRAPGGIEIALLPGVELGLLHQLQHAENAVHRGADLVAHLGEELRLGAVGFLQFEGSPPDPRFERRVQVTQLLFGALLRRVPRRQRIGHLVEGHPEAADLRSAVVDLDAGVIVAFAPFGGALQQIGDRPLDKAPAADPGQVHRGQQAEQDEQDAALGGGLDRLHRLDLRLPGAEEEVSRRQCDRHITEDAGQAIDAGGLLPAGGIAVHDVFMRFAHVLADQRLAVRQPGDDVAQPVGNQDRLLRCESALFQMLGQPFQIEAGEDDAGYLAVRIIEPLGKMDHFLLRRRIDEVISDRKALTGHGALVKLGRVRRDFRQAQGAVFILRPPHRSGRRIQTAP